MLRSDYLTNEFDGFLLKKNSIESKNHVSSGKLSASMLWQPLQWQILKIIGVPGVETDAQGFRNMYRGKQLEDEILELPFFKSEIVERQKFVEYENTVGYVDVMANSMKFNKINSVIPFEIKTVTRDKFARINKIGVADKGHLLQACFYGLATKSKKFGLIYYNSSDYRDITWIGDVQLYQDEIKTIIKGFYKVLEDGKVPIFEAKEKWQSSLQYSQYPEWSKLTEKEIEDKLKVGYPNCYSKLKKGK